MSKYAPLNEKPSTFCGVQIERYDSRGVPQLRYTLWNDIKLSAAMLVRPGLEHKTYNWAPEP